MSNILLNASKFIYNKVFYNSEFEDIMSQIIRCYNLMRLNNCSLQNNENTIRNEIVNNYLCNNDIRRNMIGTNYLFLREIPTNDDTGRVDIYVSTQNTFQDTGAYYTIECKRLDAKNQNGTTGLNAEYIQNGISRFTSQKYTTHNDVAGMIGFVVEKINIHQNINAINTLLCRHFSNIDTEQNLKYKEIIPEFEYSYSSKHKIGGNLKIIYHLMFDFSKNIAE